MSGQPTPGKLPAPAQSGDGDKASKIGLEPPILWPAEAARGGGEARPNAVSAPTQRESQGTGVPRH